MSDLTAEERAILKQRAAEDTKLGAVLTAFLETEPEGD